MSSIVTPSAVKSELEDVKMSPLEVEPSVLGDAVDVPMWRRSVVGVRPKSKRE